MAGGCAGEVNGRGPRGRGFAQGGARACDPGSGACRGLPACGEDGGWCRSWHRSGSKTGGVKELAVRTVTEPGGSIGQGQGRRRGLAGGRPVVCDGILPHDEGEGRTGSGDGTRNRACDRRIRERADRSAGVAQFGGVAPAEAWAMDSRAACVSRRPASGIVGQTGAPRAAEVREAGKSPGFGAG
jgi:hypothetical protein